jgi:hypothetical protein
MTITCPHCAVTGNTRPQTHVDCITVLIVVILLLLFWPLFWLPFVVPVSANECYGNERKALFIALNFSMHAVVDWKPAEKLCVAFASLPIVNILHSYF